MQLFQPVYYSCLYLNTPNHDSHTLKGHTESLNKCQILLKAKSSQVYIVFINSGNATSHNQQGEHLKSNASVSIFTKIETSLWKSLSFLWKCNWLWFPTERSAALFHLNLFSQTFKYSYYLYWTLWIQICFKSLNFKNILTEYCVCKLMLNHKDSVFYISECMLVILWFHWDSNRTFNF